MWARCGRAEARRQRRGAGEDSRAARSRYDRGKDDEMVPFRLALVHFQQSAAQRQHAGAASRHHSTMPSLGRGPAQRAHCEADICELCLPALARSTSWCGFKSFFEGPPPCLGCAARAEAESLGSGEVARANPLQRGQQQAPSGAIKREARGGREPASSSFRFTPSSCRRLAWCGDAARMPDVALKQPAPPPPQ
jgi:hypothetical protein